MNHRMINNLRRRANIFTENVCVCAKENFLKRFIYLKDIHKNDLMNQISFMLNVYVLYLYFKHFHIRNIK